VYNATRLAPKSDCSHSQLTMAGQQHQPNTFVYRLFRNIFSNWARTFVRGLVSLVLTPLLFHYLQPSNYAILAFALAIEAMLEALDLGMVSVLVRFVSDLDTRQLHAELNRLVSTVFYLVLGIAALGATGLTALSPLVASFFHVRGTVSSPGQLIIAVVGLTVLFQLPGAVLRALLEGYQEFHLANAVDTSSELLRAVATLIFLHAGFGLLPIAALFPAGALLRLVGMLGMAQRTKISFWPRLAEVNLASLREIRSFAFLTFAQDTITRVYSQSDSFLAAKLLPLPQLAILVVARRFPWALMRLGQQGMWVAYPIISAAAARGDLAAMKKFMLISARSLLALALPVAAALFVWAGVVLRLWVGEEVLSGVPVLRAFLVFAVMASLQESALTLLYGMGRIRFSAGLSVVTLAGALGLGTLACSGGGLSALAVVYASIQTIVTLLLCFQALRLAELEPAQWLKKAVVPAVLAEVPTVAWFLLSYRLLPHTLYGLAISTVTGILVFFGLLLKLASGPERQPWRRRMKNLLTE
jgi:O-antigen/teichoic acid export membrane protein